MRITIRIVLFLSLVLFSNLSSAATVTSTADSGPGSLRAAISNAVPGETIDFAVSGVITLTSGELRITRNLILQGPGSATLAVQRSAVAGTPDFRVFNVFLGTVTISGLTISNGRDAVGGGVHNEATITIRDCVISDNSATRAGGGINNVSTVTLSNCVIDGNAVSGAFTEIFGGGLHNAGTVVALSCSITSNSVTGGAGTSCFGGGVNNDGTLAVTNSLIEANRTVAGSDTDGVGGGIFNQGTLTVQTTTVRSNLAQGSSGEGGGIGNGLGTLLLDRSTVSDNLAVGQSEAGTGSGLLNGAGTVTVASSTISGNSASSANGPARGGGLFNGLGSATLRHSTITANEVSGLTESGSGVDNPLGVIESTHTILAGNENASDFSNGDLGTVLSTGHNLVGSTNGSVPPGPGDQFNVTAAALRVGPLQDNGGPTFTHALLCGSPAINAGDNTDAPPTDQRGFPRIFGGVIDIGAYEGDNTPPVITCSGSVTSNCAPPTGRVLTLAVNVADADGDPLVVIWAVDGVNYQTNLVAGGGRPTNTRVEFTAIFSVGSHEVTVSVADSEGCSAACSTSVTVNATPTVTCSGSITSNCAQPVTVSVNVADADGDALVVVWTVNGTPAQTNPVTGSARVDFTTSLGVGTHIIAVAVSDPQGCGATCATTLVIVPQGGDLYPIALHVKSLEGVAVGGIIKDIYNGVQPGNFGWLTWAGSPSEPTLVTSLTPPGNSRTYVNPLNRNDRTISVGDWVQGKPGVSNSDKVRKSLDTLKTIDIVVPVWDRAAKRGNGSLYRVTAFARVRITDYQLPKQNRITARFLGLVECP
jgi:hypothetical protein